MKKYECNHSKTGARLCHHCAMKDESAATNIIGWNLYAAEFLLYAFHFNQEVENEPLRQTVESAGRLLTT